MAETAKHGFDVRPVQERMIARLMEDLESGRARVSVGDLVRIAALAEQAERGKPREIEVRWIEEPAKENVEEG